MVTSSKDPPCSRCLENDRMLNLPDTTTDFGGVVSWREGSSPWGRSGPTTPATVNRSWRELREERGRKAFGRGAVRYQNGPRMAECQVRYGGDGMRLVWRGLDGWSDDPGADDDAHPQS